MLYRSFLRIVFAALLGAASTSCAEKGYRTEVYTGGQGQTQIRRVPVATVATSTQSRPAKRDPQLSEIESVWPALSPEARGKLADLAHQLAPSGGLP